ncbi:FecR domain-containing protein [Pelomonas sp. SE-A7]|uniref:FecR family protein n=1 Tax=Pelomonas sp. SE-A7 TaxID=3054953 RepID=UPI00259CE267|nr:FecR domain-containing protein [Pelomonas sp. SE-A7]MDM4768436.1 FecR domain-containing protein [Pelomonas sp. SE-A7]
MQTNVLDFERAGSSGAADEARRWIARIDAGDLSNAERQQLKDWLAEDADHKRLLDEHALIWAAASRARFPAAAKTTAAGRRVPRWAWGGAAFAGLLLALVLVKPWILIGKDEAAYAASHRTAVGQQHLVLLPDGSRTELNAASQLQVAYESAHRRVRLERGVGLFDVAKDAKRPFEVQAGHVTVRAVGTRFLVQRHADGSVEVTVYEGVVELRKDEGSQPVRLGVGQVAIDQAEQTLLSVASAHELERKLAWQQGRIVFDNTTLAAALEEVNRYSEQPIQLTDASLQEMRISGAFATREISVFLRSLEQGFGLKVRQEEGRWLVGRG